MAFFRVSGESNLQTFLKTASTALNANGFVKLTSGQLVKAALDDTTILGLSMETIATTDGDYATARPLLVDMLKPGDVLLGLASGSALTAASVGVYFDLVDDVTVDGAEGTTAGLLLCIGFIDATHGYFVPNAQAITKGLSIT